MNAPRLAAASVLLLGGCLSEEHAAHNEAIASFEEAVLEAPAQPLESDMTVQWSPHTAYMGDDPLSSATLLSGSDLAVSLGAVTGFHSFSPGTLIPITTGVTACVTDLQVPITVTNTGTTTIPAGAAQFSFGEGYAPTPTITTTPVPVSLAPGASISGTANITLAYIPCGGAPPTPWVVGAAVSLPGDCNPANDVAVLTFNR